MTSELAARVDLGKIALFKGVEAGDLRALTERTTLRTLPADAIVFSEGSPGDSIYFILSGKVKVFLHDANGKEFVLDTRTAGGYVGEMMLDGAPRSASVKTLEPSQFGVLSRNDFKEVLTSHPQVALHLIRNLIRVTRGQNIRRLEDVRTRGELQIYIEQLKAAKAEDLPTVRRWEIAKRWMLVTLLVCAILQFYFMDVLLQTATLRGISVFGGY